MLYFFQGPTPVRSTACSDVLAWSVLRICSESTTLSVIAAPRDALAWSILRVFERNRQRSECLRLLPWSVLRILIGIDNPLSMHGGSNKNLNCGSNKLKEGHKLVCVCAAAEFKNFFGGEQKQFCTARYYYRCTPHVPKKDVLLGRDKPCIQASKATNSSSAGGQLTPSFRANHSSTPQKWHLRGSLR